MDWFLCDRYLHHERVNPLVMATMLEKNMVRSYIQALVKIKMFLKKFQFPHNLNIQFLLKLWSYCLLLKKWFSADVVLKNINNKRNFFKKMKELKLSSPSEQNKYKKVITELKTVQI